MIVSLALLFATVGVNSELLPPTELVRRLQSNDEDTRLDAEQGLLSLKAEAAESLLYATCRTPAPHQNVVAATLRILRAWEVESWTNPQSAAAVDRFVELARDPRNTSGEDVPLGPNARVPFADVVRVLDVTPDAAAAFLSAKPGIKVNKDRFGFYGSVSLGSRWVVEPKDWLYIANLARETEGTPFLRDGTVYGNGRRHLIRISVVERLESDTLAECLRYLRQSIDSPIDLFFQQALINRECLSVLQAYHELKGLTANAWSDDITDEDWATSIAAWPNSYSLFLSPSAGKEAIAAASKLNNLLGLVLTNSKLVETDLESLREHKKLSTLLVRDPEGNSFIEYVNRNGTGKWQLEEARRTD